MKLIIDRNKDSICTKKEFIEINKDMLNDSEIKQIQNLKINDFIYIGFSPIECIK